MSIISKGLRHQTLYTFCMAILSIRSLLPQYLIYRNPVILDQLVLYGSFFLIFVSLIRSKQFKLSLNKLIPFWGCFFLWSITELVSHGELWIANTNNISVFVLLIIFYMLSYDDKVKTLSCMFILLTVLFTLAVVEYILFVSGIDFILQYGIERGEGSGSYLSHGIFNLYTEGTMVVRFQSLLREPGYLGMMAGLLMFVLPKVNKKLWLLWIVFGMLSMSLAYFLLFAMSLLFEFTSSKGKELAISILLIAVIGIVTFTLFSDEINEMFLARIINYSSQGYDNRSTDYANTLLNNAGFFNTWFGYSESFFYKQDMAWGTTGIKEDLIKWGYAGVIMLSMAILSLFSTYTNNKYMLFVIMILFLMLYYNADIKFLLCMHVLLFAIYDANTNKIFLS